MKRILITGGSGFVARNLKEQLEGYRIFAPSHQELDIENYVAVEQFVKKNKVNFIIHTAVSTDIVNSFSINLRMFNSIYRLRNQVNKIISFGSGAEFAKTRHLIKVKEIDLEKFTPADDYGLERLLSTLLAKNINNIIILRIFGLYGKYEDYRDKFISNSIVKNILGLPIKIKQNVIFDYLYIDDFVKIVSYFLDHNHKYADYNVAPTLSIDLVSIAKLINENTRKKSKIQLINQGFNFQYTANNKRLLTEIPDFQFTSYKKGITSLYNYYRKNMNKIDKAAILKDVYLSTAKINI